MTSHNPLDHQRKHALRYPQLAQPRGCNEAATAYSAKEGLNFQSSTGVEGVYVIPAQKFNN
jgi:hypothetical protein